jgi:diketogulonate reductase-like aldo/keto reductase
MIPTIALPGGAEVKVLGQGTWHMGAHRRERAREVTALRAGLDLGMTLIDTAEMYAEGGAEIVVGEAIEGRRDEVFLVSKLYPHNATESGVPAACHRSLQRLKVARIDLYLLHWRGNVPLAETVAALEQLRLLGDIGAWGVSNFDSGDMADLLAIPEGARCSVNQVLYHPDARGIEWDLLPFCRAQGIPVMAYSPLGQGGKLLKSPALELVAKRHGVTPAAVALAWGLRDGGVISIPKSSSLDHLAANARAVDVMLSDADCAAIDAAHRPPLRKRPLEMI